MNTKKELSNVEELGWLRANLTMAAQCSQRASTSSMISQEDKYEVQTFARRLESLVDNYQQDERN